MLCAVPKEEKRNQEESKSLSKHPTEKCIVFSQCTQYLLRTYYVFDIIEADFNSLPSHEFGIYSPKFNQLISFF